MWGIGQTHMDGVDLLWVKVDALLGGLAGSDVQEVNVAVLVPEKRRVAVCRTVKGRELSVLIREHQLEAPCG